MGQSLMSRTLSSLAAGVLLGLFIWALPIVAEAVRDFREAAREARETTQRFNEATKRLETTFCPP